MRSGDLKAAPNAKVGGEGASVSKAMDGQKILRSTGIDKSTPGTPMPGIDQKMAGGVDNLDHSLRGASANMRAEG